MELDEASGVQKFHTLNFKTSNMEYLLSYFCLRLVVDRMRVISHACFCCTGTILTKVSLYLFDQISECDFDTTARNIQLAVMDAARATDLLRPVEARRVSQGCNCSAANM